MSAAPLLSQITTERVSQALTALKELGARIVEDSSLSLTKIARKIYSEETIFVLTCPKDLADYDPESPGRIACILVGGKRGYLVVVKNRDYDVAKNVRFWYMRKNEEYTSRTCECVVCFKTGGSFLATRCFSCYGILCKRCDDKTTKDHAHRCPVCREWRLEGNSFGTPRSLLGENLIICGSAGSATDAVTELVGLLKALDGHIEILPRVNKVFLVDRAAHFEMPSLFAEDRDVSLKPLAKKLRCQLAKYQKLAGDRPDVKIYLFRKTFCIDKKAEKPVLEVSVFRVAFSSERTKLLQYSRDAWVNVFEDDDYCAHVKVEYLPPARFPLPEHVLRMFSEVAQDAGRREVTVSLTDEHPDKAKRFDLNFDCVEDASRATLTPTTIHQAFIEAELASGLVDGKTALYAIFRLHEDAPSKISDATVYRLQGHTAERLDAGLGRAILAQDLDGLNRSRTIRDYIFSG